MVIDTKMQYYLLVLTGTRKWLAGGVIPVSVVSCHVTLLQNWFLLPAFHRTSTLQHSLSSPGKKAFSLHCSVFWHIWTQHLMVCFYIKLSLQVQSGHVDVTVQWNLKIKASTQHPRVSSLNSGFMCFSKETQCANSPVRLELTVVEKILNSLETPVPWAVWCHWTRPSLSRNRSGLTAGIHTCSAYEARELSKDD